MEKFSKFLLFAGGNILYDIWSMEMRDYLSQFDKVSRLGPYMKYREETQVNQRAFTLHVLFAFKVAC